MGITELLLLVPNWSSGLVLAAPFDAVMVVVVSDWGRERVGFES